MLPADAREHPKDCQCGVCHCDCGEPAPPGARFIHNHHGKVPRIRCRVCDQPAPEGPAHTRRRPSYDAATETFLCPPCGRATRRTPRRGPRREWLTGYCSICGDPFQYPPYNDQKRCKEHRTFAPRRARPPKAPLAAFLHQEWVRTRPPLSLVDIARKIGLSRSSLLNYLDGSTPTRPNLDKLRSAFGDRLPDVTADNERRREQARAIYPLSPQPGTPEFMAARRKAGAKMRGRPKTEEHIRKAMETRRATGELEVQSERLHTATQRLDWRARRVLRNRLRGNPSPSPELVRQWAEVASSGLAMSVEMILAAWRPLLVRCGLAASGGRPRAEARHVKMLEILAAKKLTPHAPKPQGFWPEVTPLLNKAAVDAAQRAGKPARRALTYASYTRWWSDHLPGCVECAELG
jgi:hypothetical protein